MLEELKPAFSVVGHGLSALAARYEGDAVSLAAAVTPNVSCESQGEVRWDKGDALFKILKESGGKALSKSPSSQENEGNVVSFDRDGARKSVGLTIVNLQPDGESEGSRRNRWEEIGRWQSSTSVGEEGTLDIKDIVWPGQALKPPEGLPERRFIRVSFLEVSSFFSADLTFK